MTAIFAAHVAQSVYDVAEDRLATWVGDAECGCGGDEEADEETEWLSADDRPEFTEARVVPMALEPVGGEWGEIDEVFDASGVEGVQYQSKPGDTLASFASRHGLSATQLCQHNDMLPNHALKPGEWLYVVAVHADLWWVARPGQTLSEVAQVSGVPVQTLLLLNDIPDVEQLEVGQILMLPVSR